MLDINTKRRIDTARDILVGKVPDPKAQVEQITTALIYKFMDDMDKESEELGGAASFFVDKYKKYAWSKLFDSHLDGFQRVNLYAEALTKMPENEHLPQLFRDIFKDAFLPYRDPEILRLFLKEINGFTYDHSERLGDAFEYLLSVLGSQGDAGQFRTPRHIIDFIVSVVDPKKDDLILDPACGTSGFLISAYKHILQQNSAERPGDQLTPEEKTQLMKHFAGYDISPDMVRLSLVNMYLHGFPNPNVHEYDTLTSEERWDEIYDVVMANPPFMTPKGGIRPHKRFTNQASRSEVLFVDYIAEHLGISGRAAVIVPEGIIFHSGIAYKTLRKMLVEKYLWAVVSLPSGVFQPYSNVKTSILLLDKVLARKADSVLFVGIGNDGFDLGAQRRPIPENDLPQALAVLHRYKCQLQQGEDPHASEYDTTRTFKVVIARKDQITQSGDYNLSGERYRVVTSVSNQKWPHLELRDICEIRKGTPITKNEAEDGDIPVIAGGQQPAYYHNVANRTGRTITVSASGAYAGFLNYFDKPIFASDCSTIQVKAGQTLLIEYVYHVLKYKQDAIYEFQRGGGQPHVYPRDLETIRIPVPPLTIQQEVVSDISGYQKIVEGSRQVIESYRPNINIDPSWDRVRLGDICEFRNGVNYTKESSGERVKILGVKDFQDNFYAPIESLDYVVVDGHLSDNDLLKSGDIVFVRSNGNQNLIGRCVLVSNISERITHSGFTIRTVLKSNDMNPAFLAHMLKLDRIRQMMIDGGTGANIKSLSQGVLRELVVPCPPLQIQERIVHEICEEEQLINANRRLVENFQQKIMDKVAVVWGE